MNSRISNYITPFYTIIFFSDRNEIITYEDALQRKAE